MKKINSSKHMSSRLCLQTSNFQIITAFINDFNNLYDCLNGLLIYRSADKKIVTPKLRLFRFFNNTTKWSNQLGKKMSSQLPENIFILHLFSLYTTLKFYVWNGKSSIFSKNELILQIWTRKKHNFGTIIFIVLFVFL